MDNLINACRILRNYYRPEKYMHLILSILTWKKISNTDEISEDYKFGKFYENISCENYNKNILNLIAFLSKKYKCNFRKEQVDIDNKDFTLFVQAVNKIENISYEQIFSGEPDSLYDFLSLFIEDEIKSVYSPLNYYKLAYRLCENKKNVKLFTEDPTIDIKPYLLTELLDYQISHSISHPLKKPGFIKSKNSLRKFDMTISILPFGGKMHDKDIENDLFDRFHFAKNQRHLEIAFIEHIIAQTTHKALIVLPSSFLFRTVAVEKDFKKFLIQNGMIEAIIGLPQNLLPDTTIATSVLILNRNKKNEKVLFVNANIEKYRKKDTKSRKYELMHADELYHLYLNKKEIQGISRLVTERDIDKNEYNFLPEQYFESEEEKEIHEFLANQDVETLDDIVEIIRPQNIRNNESGDHLYCEILCSDIPDYGFLTSGSKEKKVTDLNLEKMQSFEVQPWDVLLSVKGTIGKVGIVNEKGIQKCIAGQTLLILRPDTAKIDPLFLYMYLKSKTAQVLLDSFKVGNNIFSLPSKAIKSFPIVILPPEEQKIARDSFEKEIDLYKKIESVNQQIVEIHEQFLR